MRQSYVCKQLTLEGRRYYAIFLDRFKVFVKKNKSAQQQIYREAIIS